MTNGDRLQNGQFDESFPLHRQPPRSQNCFHSHHSAFAHLPIMSDRLSLLGCLTFRCSIEIMIMLC